MKAMLIRMRDADGKIHAARGCQVVENNRNIVLDSILCV